MPANDRKKTGKAAPDEADSTRPRPTIELKAQDVTEVTGETPSGAAEPKASKASKAAKPPLESPGADETTVAPPAAADVSGEPQPPDPDKPPVSGQDTAETLAAKPPRREPPQRTQPSDVRAFVTHLAAGLVGGIAGVVAAGIGLDKLPLAGISSGPAMVANENGGLAEVNGRLVALEKRLGAAAGPDLTAIEKRLTGIDERLAAQASSVSEAASRLSTGQSEQAGKIVTMESTLKALGDAAKQGGGEAVAPAAAVASQINEMATRIGARIDALEARVEAVAKERSAPDAGLETRLGKIEAAAGGLDQRVAQLAAGQSANAEAAAPVDLAPLEQRLAAMDKRLDSVAGDAKAAADARSGAALALALAALRRAVEAGRPFAAELGAYAGVASQGADLSVLRAAADRGIPTLQELRASLAPALRMAQTAVEPASQNLVDQLMSGARDFVRIRRVGDGPAAPGEFGDAMRAAMTRGDLAAALAAAKELPVPAREAMKSWIGRAGERHEVEASLAALERQAAGTAVPAAN